MHIRVVRFTDVDTERIGALKERIEAEDGGPPPGVDATGIKVLLDEEQGTAVVLQFFEDEEKMRSSESALSDMDPSDTPGTRASVDRCEVVAKAEA
jgi:hypothetical protein